MSNQLFKTPTNDLVESYIRKSDINAPITIYLIPIPIKSQISQ